MPIIYIACERSRNKFLAVVRNWQIGEPGN